MNESPRREYSLPRSLLQHFQRALAVSVSITECGSIAAVMAALPARLATYTNPRHNGAHDNDGFFLLAT
jgi:hypothetical protein